MLKKSVILFLCLCFCFGVGCTKSEGALSIERGDEPPASTEPAEVFKNPLTGLSGIDKSKINARPISIMINNISTAQPVQTGLNEADIIYETEVEGGITRLMAVYKDAAKAEKIGTIRSARYPYVDLALGHDSVYVHCGQDNTYCKPHLKDIDHINISESNYGTRVSNGLSKEHTLYTYTQKLLNGVKSEGFKTELKNAQPWVNFADEASPVKHSLTSSSVTIPFSTSYKTTFKYDDSTGVYSRYFKDTLRKDYYTGETVTVKNVFVLTTNISDYPDGYHRKVDLVSGNGYYFVNGTYVAIKWSKGAAKNGFTFTNTDGTPLTVNPGTSWVCIADKGTSQPLISQ